MSKESYKYRIGFHQSLTTGVIGFEGNVNLDTKDPLEIFSLKEMLSEAEEQFKAHGYRLASDIEPKAQQVKNGQSNKEVKR